jgi:probable HAF family extracellular repeat protein
MKMTTTLILLCLGVLSCGRVAQADYFTFNNGVYTTLPIGEPGFQIGINDAGQIVGTIGGQGFLDTNGVFTTFDVPGALEAASLSGVNNSGQIVGTYANNSGNHGFLDTNGVFTTIDDPAASLSGTAVNGINDVGQIVGYYANETGDHGFLYVNGVFTTIDVPGSPSTILYGINNSGEIVGVSNGGAFLIEANGVMIPIVVPGSVGTNAFGINNSGQIVGHYSDSNFIGHGFLDTNGVVTTLDVPVGSQTQAFGIDDSGEIVGWFNPFVITPTPEPASLLLVVCGLAGLVSLCKLRRI